MLRLAGALAVFCALSWCGFQRARWYRRRAACLASWCSAVLEGERMLCDLGEPTPAYLRRLADDPVLGEMARVCLERLAQEERLETAWIGALERAALPLEPEEQRTVAELGAVIGRYDPAQQRPVLSAALGRLREQLIRAEEEQHRLGRMWPVLGLSAGALAVVLLY